VAYASSLRFLPRKLEASATYRRIVLLFKVGRQKLFQSFPAGMDLHDFPFSIEQ
jgi:hypothetical protein